MKRVFVSYNPDDDSQEIDFQANIDSNLLVSENRAILADAYPQYAWYREDTREAKFARQIKGQEDEAIDELYRQYVEAES